MSYTSHFAWTVLLPSGARLTMLPPGTSHGAETEPECYRVARHTGKQKHVAMFSTHLVLPRHIRGGAGLGLTKGVFRDAVTPKTIT